jgi:hypothetical protein
MITLLLHLFRLLPVLFGGHRQRALENLALRQQLSVYKRTTTPPKLPAMDRLFWVWLTKVWAGWRQSVVVVTPDTVLRWQRASSSSVLMSIPPPSGPPSRSSPRFPDDAAPSYLVRDRGQVLGEHFRRRMKGLRIEEVLTAPHSPWQKVQASHCTSFGMCGAH